MGRVGKAHCSDITWVLRHPGTGNPNNFWTAFSAWQKKKTNIEVSHCWSILRGSHLWTMDSPHKGAVINAEHVCVSWRYRGHEAAKGNVGNPRMSNSDKRASKNRNHSDYFRVVLGHLNVTKSATGLFFCKIRNTIFRRHRGLSKRQMASYAENVSIWWRHHERGEFF